MILKFSPWDSNNNGDNLERFLKSKGFKGVNNLYNMGGGHNNFFRLITIVFIALFTLWCVSGFYVVDEGEEAAVLRLGKYNRTSIRGLNYHLPYPLETVIVEEVERIRKEEIGFRGGGASMSRKLTLQNTNMQSSIRPVIQESLMLTSDENILDINFVVQWKVSNLKNFVFNIKNPDETVKTVCESTMREAISSTPLAIAQTEGRALVEQQAKDLAQKALDLYKSGIEIVNLQMLKVDPPAEVIDAFRDVQTAKADKERAINQAQSYVNDILPKASGNASKLIQEAEGYKQEVIARAQGDVKRFNSVYEQYKKAPDVTRKRMYLDTMAEIMTDMEKVIINSKNSSSIVPYLPLPRLDNERKN